MSIDPDSMMIKSPTYRKATSINAAVEDIELGSASTSASLAAVKLKDDTDSLLPEDRIVNNNKTDAQTSQPPRYRFSNIISTRAWDRWLSRRGWGWGLIFGLYTSRLVLITDLVLLMIGSFSYGGLVDGIGTIAKRDAKKVQQISTMYHILINILSSILLVSSNYAMQVLCSPTRKEIDEAHA
ncbi:hypothetical protein BCR34DRAFT_609950 [Clohesyomyces aquaticus]|uniref:DUF6536 domain-containing protein n=1 Tax=Clohesyomyces aquaticus TaxID=1231657 RepID=A0A1Y2A8W2_9PLEO|nr:hypothetical protein BCR34DRAFT_609950 [Clohesyomyces aquaticus]